MSKPATSRFATYDEVVAYLFSAINFEKVSKYSYDPATLNLKREHDLLASVGNPHERQDFVHIAGTKGKGSTGIMLASILTAHGLKTGLLTSPHLVHVEERITINGEMMSKPHVVEVMNQLAPHIDSVRAKDPREAPTYWEILTAMAFLYCFEERCDVSVIEVGLGGRLDSTNVITPKVSVITRIDYDHTEKLGRTLTKIAGEKAAIIKEDIPVVASPQAPEAQAVIENRARETNSELRHACRILSACDTEREDRPGILLEIEGQRRRYDRLFVPLIGEHQAENVATAVAAAEALEDQGIVELSAGAIRECLGGIVIPGRIEIISHRPLIVLDCAHNVVSARALRRAITRRLRFDRMVLLLGMSMDKDLDGFLSELVPLADRVLFTKVDNPRAADAEDLAERSRRISPVAVEAIPTPEEALAAARRGLSKSDLLCITGSFYLAGKMMEILSRE
ncbi:MAG: bifunctional folylpolyglutamate synthase/dihydrofolate synthase [Planctomycetes bacterium]|nr:bifunctional folylpolyglutamate synthase/dihydrofolate synthase [Planctomycetota bacterium]